MEGHQEKTFYKAEIGGMSFNLKSQYDEEMLQKLVAYVDKKFKEAHGSMKNASFQMAAILTALNIAEELLLLKKHTVCDLNEIENKAQKILAILESSQKTH